MCSLCSTVCSQSSLLPLGLSVCLSVCRSGHMTTSTSTSSNCSSPCVCVQPAHTHSHTEQETKPSLSWAAPCSAACVWVCECVFQRAPVLWRPDMAGLRSGHGATVSPQRSHAAAVTLLSALLTCCVRCAAEPSGAKPSNIVLIVADDQDVLLGGMVSGPAWTHLSSIITCIDPEESTMTSDWVFIVTWMKFKVTLSNFIVFLSADYRLYVTTEGRCDSLLINWVDRQEIHLQRGQSHFIDQSQCCHCLKSNNRSKSAQIDPEIYL